MKLVLLGLVMLCMLHKPIRKWNNKLAMIHCKCPNQNGAPSTNQKQHSEISFHMQCLLKFVLQGQLNILMCDIDFTQFDRTEVLH